MIIDEINLSPLIKAFAKFEQFRKNNNSEQEKAGTVQAFEYCFELVWKTMKKLLYIRGLDANSPRETFRMAAVEGLIDNPEIWFDFLKKRNLTTHTYDENQLDQVVAIFPSFSQEIEKLLKKIEAVGA